MVAEYGHCEDGLDQTACRCLRVVKRTVSGAAADQGGGRQNCDGHHPRPGDSSCVVRRVGLALRGLERGLTRDLWRTGGAAAFSGGGVVSVGSEAFA